MSKEIIETFDLTKVYKLKKEKIEVNALKNVNMNINKGEVFGLLGPNGAGKTTLVQILSTLITPTSGYAKIDGYNILKRPRKARARVALMLGSSMLYRRITAYDNLKFFCKMYNVQNYKQKIFEITKDFGLEKRLRQYLGEYSTGMKMKLALCRTLLLERPILFLDEPTSGLDVQSRAFMIQKLKALPNTILLTSHDMGVVEKVCDRIAFINNGNIVKIGTKEDIQRAEHTEIIFSIHISEDKNQLKKELAHQNFVKKLLEVEKGLIISLKERKYLKNLLLILSNYNILKLIEQETSLEDLFLKMIYKSS